MAQTDRKDIDEKYKWNLSDLYSSKDVWAEHKKSLAEKIKEVSRFKGHIADSAIALLDFFTFDSNIEKEMARLSIYASLLSDQDVNNAENLALVKEIESLSIDYVQLTHFVRPELSAISADTYAAFTAQQPSLAQYSMAIDRILRGKEHTLSDVEEELLSKVSMLGNTPYSTFSVFSDAEMPFPTITTSDGQQVVLDHSAFARLRASEVRDDRQKAFYAFWENYRKFEGTFGELTDGNLRRKVFAAQVRKYPSALDSALSYNNIPRGVYTSLIDNVNKNLDTFHRYLRLKKRLLGVDRLEYADVYAPAVAKSDLHFTYEEAQQMVIEALAPLGTQYVDVVRRAFRERWIDVMPCKGKATGAYSNGAAYDVHPYILMNFDGLYDHVGTLIHELGHTMHSYLSNASQPFPTCDYSIFVAEVASTFNEALLDNMMLRRLTDRNNRIELIMNMLDGFKGTLFRQAQFAEFQLRMTEMAERSEPITGQKLSALYGEILRRYYGHDSGVCYIDPVVDIEWAFIPHFYMGFYVYQYSTSFVASQALSEIVLQGSDAERNRYLNFLSAGDSKYPIDELRDAGVDMLSDQPFNKAISKMNNLIDQLESLL